MNLPKRFNLTYVAEDGSKKEPVMVHRALFGSLERFIAILTEHFGGLFPLWLAPIQVRLIPVSAEIHGEHAKKLCDELISRGIRCDVDSRDEKLGYRMREAQLKKVPLTVVVGDNEMNNNTVTYRKHGTKEQVCVSVEEFVELILSSYPRV
jgi:threonyl-tRNA synthetase